MSEPLDIAAITQRVEAATPLPWHEGIDGNRRIYGPDNMGDLSGLIASFVRRADIKFLVAARTDIPALLEDRKVLLSKVAALEAREDDWERLDDTKDAKIAELEKREAEAREHLKHRQITGHSATCQKVFLSGVRIMCDCGWVEAHTWLASSGATAVVEPNPASANRTEGRE